MSMKLTKAQLLAIAVTLVLLLGAGGAVYAWWSFNHRPKPVTVVRTPTPTPVPTPTPTPVKKASPLTGVLVDPATAAQPVFSVIIENHPDARPQSGLSQAGVVYEANAEGGITRFQAFFLDSLPKVLARFAACAPTTSTGRWSLARPSRTPAATLTLSTSSHRSASRASTASTSARPTSTAPPTSTPPQLLHRFRSHPPTARRPRLERPGHFHPQPAPSRHPHGHPRAPQHSHQFLLHGYQVDYAYDATANDYARSLAGAPHIDANTGQQIHVKNVVVEYMPTPMVLRALAKTPSLCKRSVKAKPWFSATARPLKAPGRKIRTPPAPSCSTPRAKTSRLTPAILGTPSCRSATPCLIKRPRDLTGRAGDDPLVGHF